MPKRAKSRAQTASTAQPSAAGKASSAREGWAGGLDAIAFFMVLLIVSMRPMLGETFYSHLDSISRAAQSVGDPTPATTAWLDFGIWTAAILAAAAKLLRRRPWRFTGVEIGAGILVVAAAISTFAASNRRLALNASADWLTALVLVAVVANLCRDRMRIGLLLAGLAASGMATVARSGMQVGVEYPETFEHYEQTKADFWGGQNVLPDDPRVVLYERRMQAAEANGFLPLSNINGAWLSVAGFAFLGLRGLVWRKRWAAMLLLLPAGVSFAAIFLTGSRGALLATALGLVIWGLLSRYHLLLQDRWRLTLLGGWVILAGVISAGITYGVAQGGLPGDSLQFRWNYWQVTRDIVAHNIATGVGALNFDSAYLSYKPAEYPEEIRDPHNFILSILAQWGIIGGIGLLAVFAGASWVAARTWGTREPTDSPPPVYDPEAKYLSLQWVVAVALGFVVLRIFIMRGWLEDPTGIAYVFFDLGLYGVIWILVLAGVCWIARGGWTGDIDICQVACLAGAVAFILHSLIDLAMFFPGTLMPFAAMAGILVTAKPSSREATQIASKPGVPLAVLAVCAVFYAVLVLVPTTRANLLLHRGRSEAYPPEERVQYLQAAVGADPWDSTAQAELARWHVEQSGDISEALGWLNEAIQRDPEQIGLYRSRAGLLEASFHQTGSISDLVNAIGAARRVVAMYPNSPDDHLLLADMLARNTDALGAEALGEAILYYQIALELDAARGESEIRRWPQAKRRAVEQRLAELTDQIAETRPATQPS